MTTREMPVLKTEASAPIPSPEDARLGAKDGQPPSPGRLAAAAALGDPGDPGVTTQSQVYRALRQMLMNGDLVPCERLVVRDLAERFKTSATPVREALRQLVSEGALEDSANRGVIVPEVTQDAVRDLVRARCLVEGAAAEWAAASMSGAELVAISAINDEMRRVVQNGTAEDYLILNRAFHFAIYRAARSPVLMPIIERLWLRAGPWLEAMRSEEGIRFGLDHHREIIAALGAGDGVRARNALALDLSDAGEIILRNLASGLGSAAARPRAGKRS